ncbi:PAS domain S-box protein [Flavobacterium salmonis]|uniref:histidine kinase n=1 Tax=Flavobacterium salmonis TaxID=2654844 RepID=A0A6V6YSX0_9FLAO|nr:PAS domain S-box protein [Flavobacterium salmonis]CAD0002404.1 Sensor histidine kinase RcsC [Flavobacterium salmonis]
MNHFFKENENKSDKAEVSLRNEQELKQKSISSLFDSLQELDHNYTLREDKKQDILFLSKYLGKQISKRKYTEKKLFETVEFLKVLLDSLQSGIVVVDNNDTILFVNQYFCNIRGLKVSPSEMIGQKPERYLDQAQSLFYDSKNYRDRVAEILKEGKIVLGEILETRDNRFVERDYIPIIIENQCIGHLWKSQDVTLRIKNKNLLNQSEERNRIIMNSSLNAIITVDNSGRITFWNNQAEVIFGWKREEILGKMLNDTIIHKKNKRTYVNILKHYINTEKELVLNKPFELFVIDKNNIEFPIELSLIPLKQNGELFFCSFIQDISERKRAETKLRFQEEKYRNIIANMNLGLIEINNDGVIQFANQGFAKMSGFEVSELIGLNPTDMLVFEKKLDFIKTKKELRKKGISDLYQIPVKNKSGELRWWAVGGAPNYDDTGNLTGSICIQLDITEQKKLEIELENEKVKAQKASKAKEIFLADMSHEIRTPLNAIIGFLREMERQQSPDIQKQYLKDSTIASNHLLSIVNNILDISKIEAGEMALLEEDFVFSDAINNIVTVLKHSAKEKGLKLSSHIDNDIYPYFKGDFLRLGQILFNLIGNALKFTDNGGISLSCTLIKDFGSFQQIKISVVDSGIGMEKNYAENIFNKFSQENTAITRKFGGTGLGMAITKELLHLMNGEIIIQSTKGKGTTVEILLSFNKGNIDTIRKASKEVLMDISGIKVLLVEDNIINRKVVINSLNYFDCIVTEAVNGIQAVEILKQKDFDIILMDVQMPQMDGFQATKYIRNNLKITTPIIAFTANAFKSEVEKCKTAGMDDYVTKPFEEKILVQTIAKHITKKQNTNLIMQKEIKLYDLKNFHLMSKGNQDFVQKMISVFINKTVNVIDKIDFLIEINDFQMARKLLHKIKPSLEIMGITSFYDDMKEIEKMKNGIEEKEKEKITILFLQIKSTLIQTIEQLRIELENI